MADQVKQKTDALSSLLGGIEYFVKAAYPENGQVLMEFGFEKMTNTEQTGPARFVVNAYTLLQVLTDYKADLQAVGKPATMPAEFKTACLAIFRQFLKS